MQVIVNIVADESRKQPKGDRASHQSHCDGPPQVTCSTLAAFKSDEAIELPDSNRGGYNDANTVSRNILQIFACVTHLAFLNS